MSDQVIRFWHKGQIQSISGLPTTTTVLQYLRQYAACKGSKEGCAEGDCGACTVVIGQLDADNQFSLTAINACIQLLPTLNGKALITVEDLQSTEGQLHPVQLVMVNQHASQCGFCTPGFIMSLWVLYQTCYVQKTVPDHQQITDALSGNLCRCTGYKPIIEAAAHMMDLPYDETAFLPLNTIHQALLTLQKEETFYYHQDSQYFYAPKTLSALADLYQKHSDARILAGSTDIGLWVTKQFRELNTLIYIGDVNPLKFIQTKENALEIGAAVTLEMAYAALAEAHPDLYILWKRFASKPVRQAGTLGGNIANGSPIGDSMPALIAIGAEVVLQCGDQQRVLPLENLYISYQKTAMQVGEFIVSIRVPFLSSNQHLKVYKISKRFDQDISAICAGFMVEIDNNIIQNIRIAFGGMAAIPKRALATEKALMGQVWCMNTIQSAMAILSQDYSPMSDMRASAQYRSQMAENLLYRYFVDLNTEHSSKDTIDNNIRLAALTQELNHV